MAKFVFSLVLTMLAIASATADQYWIAYEANDDGVFPEDCGWDRTYGNWNGLWQGEAIRTVDNGIFTTDSLYDDGVYDFVWIERPGQIDPGPGEIFVAEWRLKVDRVIGNWYDPTMMVGSDDARLVGFGFYEDHIESGFEQGVTIPIAPHVYHDYRLLSRDMLTYELYIDAELTRVGVFWQGATESYIAWGDGVQGAASLAHWDCFRLGVVPEPGSGASFAVLLVWCATRRS